MNAIATKERPILFSGPMVRAILDGRKTQTRRVAKNITWISKTAKGVEPYWRAEDKTGSCSFHPDMFNNPSRDVSPFPKCPYSVGDRLWVRETWAVGKMMDHKRLSGTSRKVRSIHYLADGPKPDWAGRTRVSIHMPRWASRITLEITGVRVERLNEISEQDAIAEGVCSDGVGHPGGPMRVNQRAFKILWESINGEGSWALNPWVWVIEFRKV